MAIQTLGLSPAERRQNPLNNPVVPLSSPGAWGWLLGERSSDAGEMVDDSAALQQITCFTCIKILAEDVASLPLKLYQKTERGRIEDTSSPLSYILSTQSNEEMSRVTFIETMMGALCLTGNCYAEIGRNPATKEVTGLWPLSPRLTRAVRLPSGDLAYQTSDGETAGQYRTILAQNMIHCLLYSLNGIVGLSPIQQCARSIGSAIASEKYAARLFANGGIPQITINTDQMVKPEDKAKIRKDWEELHSGRNQHRVAVLDSGMTISKMSLTPEESQFLQTRRASTNAIASMYRIPISLLGETQKMSNANSEQAALAYITSTLRGYLVRLEAELTRKLLTRNTQYIIEFDLTELLRGDFLSQSTGFSAGRLNGWFTGNDVRRALRLNEAGPELDVFLSPANCVNARRLLDDPDETEMVVNDVQ